MKHLLSTFLIFSSFYNANCQPHFSERTYGLGRGVFIDLAQNNNYIIGANIGSHPSQLAYNILINEQGDTIRTMALPTMSLRCIRQLSDGGFICIGDSGGSVNRIARINRVDSVGNLQWVSEYPLSDWGTWGTSIVKDLDGGYFIGLVNDGDGPENTYYIFKTDSTGQAYDTSIVQYPESSFLQNPGSMQLTVDSGVIAAPSTPIFGSIRIVKLSAQLDSQWTKQYFPAGNLELTGNYIIQTSDSGYLVLGYQDSLSGTFISCGYLLKVNQNGDSIWTNTYSIPNTSIRYVSALEDSNGDIYISGLYQINSNNTNAIIILKVNSIGNTIWSRLFFGSGSAYASSMMLDQFQNPMVLGYTRDSLTNLEYIYLIKADSILSGTPHENFLHENLFDIFPNPVNSILSLQNKKRVESKISCIIRNSLGQILYRKNEISLNEIMIQRIDISSFANGIYLLQMSAADFQLNFRIIKN